jgi:hypothetical protein
MAVFLVLVPSEARAVPSAAAERAVLIKEAFSVLAFALTPVWLIWRRAWRWLLVYLVGLAALYALAWALSAGAAGVVVGTLWSLLFGLEAATIRADALERRGYAHVASVVADDTSDAEIKYLHSAATARPRPVPPPLPSSVPRVSAASPVLGVFPARGETP